MGNIKLSEARILVLMELIKFHNRFAQHMANKLDMDYQYTLHILKNMLVKGWIYSRQPAVKIYYTLTSEAPLKQAKDKIRGG